MAKRKTRESLMAFEFESEKIKLSSGVTVEVKPFPAGLWERINQRAFDDHPDPIPPKKEIKVVDGVEEVDDLTNEDYLKQKQEVERARNNILGEAIVDFCLDVIQPDIESLIKRIEKYAQKYPIDPDERRVKFLIEYALRTQSDYESVMVSATTQMMVSDPEVKKRLDFFRGQMAQSTSDEPDASGANEEIGMDV